MVAKFLDDNKPKTSLEINKKRIRTVSNFEDLIQFHIICQMTAKISAVKSERTVCSLEQEKGNFCVVLAYSVKQVREIWKFHVVQRRLKKVQKRLMLVPSSCFSDINLLLFSSSLCRRRRRCLSSQLL